MDKVLLAFTGGVQSSVCLHWLRDHRGCKVKAFIADLGQTARASEFGEQALRLGAEGAHIEDLREEYCRDYVTRILKASAVHRRHNLLSSALPRPLIAAALVRIAREENFRYVAHGAGARSNDLARFEASIAALAPDLKVLGPRDIPCLRNREEALKYALEHEIVSKADLATAALNIDVNLWGSCVAADPRTSTWEALPESAYQITSSPLEAPAEPEEIVVEFQKGIPMSVDGRHGLLHELIAQLNQRAGRHGVGRVEIMEDRLVGIKAREIHETPGGTVLMAAHNALEELTLDYETLQAKAEVALHYAELVYNGGWFSQLREALDAFVEVTQEYVSGEVRLEMFRGNVSVSGRRSPWSLYDAELVLSDDERRLEGKALGEIWSLRAFPYRVTAMLRSKGRNADKDRR